MKINWDEYDLAIDEVLRTGETSVTTADGTVVTLRLFRQPGCPKCGSIFMKARGSDWNLWLCPMGCIRPTTDPYEVIQHATDSYSVRWHG